MADEILRLLKKASEVDPSLKEAYIRALERVALGSSSDEAKVEVWVALHCHPETNSNDVAVFTNYLTAMKYIANQIVISLVNINHPQLDQVWSLWNNQQYEALDGLYTAIGDGDFWFEISGQPIRTDADPEPENSPQISQLGYCQACSVPHHDICPGIAGCICCETVD